MGSFFMQCAFNLAYWVIAREGPGKADDDPGDHLVKECVVRCVQKATDLHPRGYRCPQV